MGADEPDAGAEPPPVEIITEDVIDAQVEAWRVAEGEAAGVRVAAFDVVDETMDLHIYIYIYTYIQRER